MQVKILRALNDHGSWSTSCGWVWGATARTQRVLDALVKRGDVVVEKGVYKVTR